MKKSVIFVISMIYIVSLVIVGFLGMKMRVYDEVVYVTDIVCKFEGSGIQGTPVEEGIHYFYRVRYTQGVKVQITSEVIPDNATNSAVTYFGYDDDVEKQKVTFEEPEKNVAVVTFNARGDIFIFIQSTDGTKLQKGIQIAAL